MKATEKDIVSHNHNKTSIVGSNGRGSSREYKNIGGRGRSLSTVSSLSSRDRGGRNNSNSSRGRHSRQQHNNIPTRKQQNNKSGRGKGRGRPRSSSYNKSDAAATLLKKRSGPYAHLFCSERHSFGLSRVLYPLNDDKFLLPTNIKEESSQRIASETQFENWWESVRFVRCQVTMSDTNDGGERCPICLDEDMISPYIAPCGHSFCLPCILGYLNSVTCELNKESDRIKKNKQTNGKVVVGSSPSSSRAVSITSIRARCPLCSSGSSTELKAGDSIITYKDLRPFVFVTVLPISASTQKACNAKGKKCEGNQPGSRMRFVKLHRQKQCPSPYLPLNGHRIRGISLRSSSDATTIDQNILPDFPDGDDDTDECQYTRHFFAGVDEYENILQRDLDDLNNYHQSYICKMDKREDFNVSMSIEAIQASQRRWFGGSGSDGGFRSMELEAKSTDLISRVDGLILTESIKENEEDDDAKAQGKKASPKKSALLPSGSFHLHRSGDSNADSQGESSEFVYYQAADGQPFYLSGINVACLMHEFSLHEVDETQDDNLNDHISSKERPRNTLPLPDEFEATVLEIEQALVSNDLIKRKHFLSHVPVGSSVAFAEVDLYSGGENMNRPMLSHGTLSKFKGELQRRKSERQRAVKIEQKQDLIARTRAEKEEQRRRRELLGSRYSSEGADSVQTIDPDDDFFQATTHDESEAAAPSSPTFKFNEVCASGGVFPALSSSHETAAYFPPLQSTSEMPQYSPSHKPNATIWGSRKSITPTPKKAEKTAVNNFPSLSELSLSTKSDNKAARIRKGSIGSWGSER